MSAHLKKKKNVRMDMQFNECEWLLDVRDIVDYHVNE